MASAAAAVRERTPSLSRMLLTWRCDGAFTEEEPAGDLVVGRTRRHQGEHLELSSRQRVRRRPASRMGTSAGRPLQRLHPAHVGLRAESRERRMGELELGFGSVLVVERAARPGDEDGHGGNRIRRLQFSPSAGRLAQQGERGLDVARLPARPRPGPGPTRPAPPACRTSWRSWRSPRLPAPAASRSPAASMMLHARRKQAGGAPGGPSPRRGRDGCRPPRTPWRPGKAGAAQGRVGLRRRGRWRAGSHRPLSGRRAGGAARRARRRRDPRCAGRSPRPGHRRRRRARAGPEASRRRGTRCGSGRSGSCRGTRRSGAGARRAMLRVRGPFPGPAPLVRFEAGGDGAAVEHARRSRGRVAGDDGEHRLVQVGEALVKASRT